MHLTFCSTCASEHTVDLYTVTLFYLNGRTSYTFIQLVCLWACFYNKSNNTIRERRYEILIYMHTRGQC